MLSVLLFGKFKNILFVVYSMMLMIGSQWNLKVGGEVVMCVLVLLWKTIITVLRTLNFRDTTNSFRRCQVVWCQAGVTSPGFSRVPALALWRSADDVTLANQKLRRQKAGLPRVNSPHSMAGYFY